jgi:ribosomal-protein-alanine N-acetyltransferase
VSDLIVRAMTVEDLDAVAAIERHAFVDPWSIAAFADLLTHAHARLLVAVDGDSRAIVGHCVLLRMADEAEVANIATAASHRRRGVGHGLLREALSRCDAEGVAATFLEVRESNVGARALYTAHAFHEVGRRPRYYRHPEEDALLLRRDFPMGASFRLGARRSGLARPVRPPSLPSTSIPQASNEENS